MVFVVRIAPTPSEGHVDAETIREEHSVRIDLHRPFMTLMTATLGNALPSLHENFRVEQVRLESNWSMETDGEQSGPNIGRGSMGQEYSCIAENHKIIACEDTHVVLNLQLHKCKFNTLSLHDREAKERLVASCCAM